MPETETETVTYRCWCEHDGCDWTREVTERTNDLAQRCSAAVMSGHGIAENHHRTFRKRVSEKTE